MSKLGAEFKQGKRYAHKQIDKRIKTRAEGTAADYRKLAEVNINKDHTRPGDAYRCESEGHQWRGAAGKEKRIHTPR